MVKLRYFNAPKEVIMMDPALEAQVIDGLYYLDTGKVRYLEEKPQPLGSMRPYACVEIETGFEDNAGEKTLLFVLPREQPKSVSTFLMNVMFLSMLALLSVGCGASANSFTYTCIGDACAWLRAQTPVYYVQEAPPRSEAQVVYVNRPIEIEIVQHRSRPTRRARPVRPIDRFIRSRH